MTALAVFLACYLVAGFVAFVVNSVRVWRMGWRQLYEIPEVLFVVLVLWPWFVEEAIVARWGRWVVVMGHGPYWAGPELIEADEHEVGRFWTLRGAESIARRESRVGGDPATFRSVPRRAWERDGPFREALRPEEAT